MLFIVRLNFCHPWLYANWPYKIRKSDKSCAYGNTLKSAPTAPKETKLPILALILYISDTNLIIYDLQIILIRIYSSIFIY
jgi:hypothetical protein